MESVLKWSSHVTGASLGAAVATAILAGLLTQWVAKGQVTPTRAEPRSFTVAMLRGEKQAAADAPENMSDVVDAPIQATPAAAQAVASERETSLPQAVAAAPSSTPSKSTQAEEVIPPSKVSMPGGRLALDESPLGEMADPFGVGPSQVFIRVIVDEHGRPVEGEIVRPGSDPMRDRVILRAMLSRRYDLSQAIKTEGKTGGQIDMVLSYGTADVLP